jgi:uncharacterized YccA/Bax inhibitor family protein
MAFRVRFRFQIGQWMVVTALVALFVGFFAPELRTLDRNARLLFGAIGVVIVVLVASFTPVWLVLLRLRRRARRGLGVGAVDYAAVAVAYASSLGILVAVFLAIRRIVAR